MCLDEVLEHYLTGIWRTRHLGPGRKTITVKMHCGDTASVFGSRIQRWHINKPQRARNKGERIDNPAAGSCTFLKQIRR